MSRHPSSIGLDTSFFLRLLLAEPVALAEKAIAKLDEMKVRGEKGAVSDLVVSEAYFALHYHYEVPKQMALNKLREFLQSPEIDAVGHSLEVLAQPRLGSSKPGFVDRLIHAQYLQATSGMLTFEKAAAKLNKVTIPR
jgi:predicted nucleic-acid-binding protein